MICGTVGLGSHRVCALLSAKWRGESGERERVALKDRTQRHADQSLEARRVAVLERRIALKERQFTERPQAEPMPDDLVQRIDSWEDSFAQDEERSRLIALYADLRDWDKVRAQLPALRPFTATEIAAPRDGMVQ